MTVIAAAVFADGTAVVSADGMVVKGDGSVFPSRKIVRTRSGIAAAAGDNDAVMRFLEWQRTGADPSQAPRFPKGVDFEGLVVKGRTIYDFGGQFLHSDRVGKKYHAIGAGGKAALAVLAYQAASGLELDPEAAVRAVCKVSSECGLPVSTVRTGG